MTLSVLSLGAGIQSSAILLMSDRGMLPKLDCAIFADTGWEPQAVYEQLAWLEGHVSIPVHRVTCGRSLRDDVAKAEVRGVKARGAIYMPMPVFTETGMLRRQCTKNYKILPIERYIRRELLHLKFRQRAPRGVVVQEWLGISSDEVSRVRTSKHYWLEFAYPLLGIPEDLLPKPWSRLMCNEWLREEYPDRDWVRSACIGCPYRSNAEWRAIKAVPVEWQDAVEVDQAIRKSGGKGDVYLHRAHVDLDKVNIGEDQAEIWGEECAGVCGV